MTQQQIIIKLFDHFYMKVYESTGFYLKADQRNETIISNFLLALSKEHHLQSLGVEFFIDYFCFSWDYWQSKKVHRRVNLGWIVGEKALNRWYARNEHYKYFYKIGILKTHKISLTTLREIITESNDVYNQLSDAEEIEKVRLTGEARLYNCLQNTTLFNHMSKHCRQCRMRVSCKALLNTTNRKLYLKRGYK